MLLAVRDGEQYVASAISSLLRQTLSDLEVIVVDDGSQDGTPAILRRIRDPRLRVHRHDRPLGLAASLNEALERSSGRYVARLDADDVALPHRLERQLAWFRSRPGAAVVGSGVAELLPGGRIGRLHQMPGTPALARWHALFSSPFFHPTVVVDRAVLDRHGLRYDPGFQESEDYDLFARLLSVADGGNVREPLVLYRRHPDQASERRRELQRACQRRVALRQIASLHPGLGERRGELAFRLGAGLPLGASEVEEAVAALVALLDAFRARYPGAEGASVEEAAARAIARAAARARRPELLAVSLRLAPQLAIRGPGRRAARLASERATRPRLQAWLRRLEAEGRPLRVTVVSPEPTPYRAPLFDRLFARPELDLTVVYASRTVAGRAWDVPLRHRAVFLQGVAVPGARRLLRHDYPLTPGIVAALRQARPDVVVVSGWSTFASQAAIAWCWAQGIPYLVIVPSHDLGPKPGWRRAVKASVVPRVLARSAGVLVLGSLARASAIAWGASPKRTWLFANTIDVDAYVARFDRLACRRPQLRGALGLEPGDVACLCVARLVPEKGIDTLLRAAAAGGVRPVLVGGGPERGRLRDLDRRLGTRAVFADEWPWQRMVEAYVAADIFCLLSRHEPWGVVVNEAAACALPLVLSDRVGAAHDLLREGENGHMVRADDVEAAAAALRELAADPALRRRWGARSREIVSAWRYEESVESFLAACREALGREATRSAM